VVIPSENFLALCAYLLRYCKFDSNLQSELVEDLKEDTYHGVDVMNNITDIVFH